MARHIPNILNILPLRRHALLFARVHSTYSKLAPTRGGGQGAQHPLKPTNHNGTRYVITAWLHHLRVTIFEQENNNHNLNGLYSASPSSSSSTTTIRSHVVLHSRAYTLDFTRRRSPYLCLALATIVPTGSRSALCLHPCEALRT